MGVITRQHKYIEAVMRAGEYQFKDKSSTKCVAELTELFKVKDIERFYTLPMQCKAWTCEQKEKYPHFFEWIEEFLQLHMSRPGSNRQSLHYNS